MTLPRERQRERGREWKWGREKESCSGSWQLCLSRLHPHSHSPLASSPTLLFPLLSLSLFPATLCQSVTMSWTKRNRSSLNVCQREYARSIWRPTWRSFTHTFQLRPTSLHSLSSAAVAVAQFQSRLQCRLALLPLLLPGSISWAFCTQPQPTPQLQPPQPHTHPHASRTAPTSSGEAAVVATAVAVAVACPMTVRCRCCCRCLSAASSASAAVDECVCVCKLNKCTHFCVFVCVYKHM